ncbi:MAG: helix-turn-helix domain-containing protein [Acidimicrobiia bacterium]
MTDFLTELIEERGEANEHFAELVAAAFKRRELVRQLAEIRTELSISQTRLAALMGTSQSAVARLESGDTDARASTLARYAAALGHRIEFEIVEESIPRSDGKPQRRRQEIASA